MDIFWISFFILLFVCALLYYMSNQADTTSKVDMGFQRFQYKYLCIYLLAMGGDWLQGPYVYALYQHYGMTSHEIDVLFVVGFGSSMIFGTFAGAIADKYGRRLNCMFFALLYMGSCVTKHFPNFTILLLGRLLGGISTSILFSAFESWVVCEHHKRQYDDELLGVIFSKATLFNSVVSIAAGQVAQVAADMFGYVAPFDVAILVLAVLLFCLPYLWNENYGDQDSDMQGSFVTAFKVIFKDKKIFLLGIIQSFFESSMYMFVLKWTPSLTPSNEKTSEETSIPHGLIFSSFMVSVMIGSFVFKYLTKTSKIEYFMKYVLMISAVSLLVPILVPENQLIILVAFFVFEVCVGIFWPSFATMRGHYVPETVRSTIMNIFRVPLNLIVLLVLLQDFKTNVIFSFCVAGLLLASISQHILCRFAQSAEIASKADITETV